MTSVCRLFVWAMLSLPLHVSVALRADDPKENSDKQTSGQADDVPPKKSDDGPGRFELSEQIHDILSPLFVAIKNAEVSRATIEVLSDSLMSGQVVDSKKSTYQIASKSPDKFTIYLKEPSQRTRIYNDGQAMVVALAPDAFFRLPDPMPIVDAIAGLPVPLGPYPEPILALTLAGIDPATSLVSGMKSIVVVDNKNFRGKIPAVHLRGVQADVVSWDLWLSKDDPPKPLRMLVDLTPMLLSSPELQLPKAYSHQIRFDFLAWRIAGTVDDALFAFAPAKDATEYKSLDHYNESVAALAAQHRLLGKAMPPFKASLLDNSEIESKDLDNKVVVIDFWASWHGPSAVILPTIKEVTDKFADKDVIFLSMNIRENAQEINAFLTQQKLDLVVAMDADGSITNSFSIETLPLTIVVGKSGKIESVHDGFPGKDSLVERLTDELEVLAVGGRIATASNEVKAEASEQVDNKEAEAEK